VRTPASQSAPLRADLTDPQAQPAGAVQHRKPAARPPDPTRVPAPPPRRCLTATDGGATAQTRLPSPTEAAVAPLLPDVGTLVGRCKPLLVLGRDLDPTARRAAAHSVVGQLAKPDRDQSLPPGVGEPALLKPRPIEPRALLRRPQRGVPFWAARRSGCRRRRPGRRPAHRRRRGRLDVGGSRAVEQPGRWVRWSRNRHGGGA
jgi:hypothetical protein